jgi:hypothetical protein
MTSITSLNPVPPKADYYAFKITNDNAKLFVPNNSIEAYRNAERWSEFKTIQAISGSTSGAQSGNKQSAGAPASGSAPPPAASAPAQQGPVPAGYSLGQEVKGDLNKDGIEDRVLLVKGKNGGGVIVLLGKDGGYETVVSNLNCFPDGDGVFGIEINKRGNLIISRGGFNGGSCEVTYAFRYKDSDFELIGEDFQQTGHSPNSYSINYLSKKKQVKTLDMGTNKETEKWENLDIQSLRKLSKITDFVELCCG